jgi:Ca2+/H+ antiporter, TMEM165/GDT1 family
MQAFIVSAALVALAEFGDKTQMLALALAARFRRPAPILLGILFGTLANHALAAAAGAWIAASLGPRLLRSLLGLSFIAMSLWTLRPGRYDPWSDGPGRSYVPERLSPKLGVFGTALAGFFLLEMGDKTQIATLTLAAHYHTLVPVLAGSTLGMLCTDALAVLLGEVAARKLPLRLLRGISAGMFLLIGALVLLGAKA